MTDHEILVLTKKLQRARDSEKYRDVCDYCCSLAACYSDIGEPEEALKLYKESLKVGIKINSHKNQALANRMIAEVSLDLGHYDEAFQHANSYLNYARVEDDKIEIQRALQTIGRIYYSRAAVMSHTMSPKALKTDEFNDLLNKSLNAYHESYSIALEITEISEKERSQMVARLFQNKGVVLLLKKDLNQAKCCLIRATKICMKEMFKDTGYLCSMSLGEVYMQKQEYESALKIYNKATELAQCNDSRVDAAAGQVEACINLGDVNKAKETLKALYKTKPHPDLRKMLQHVVTIIKLENSLGSIPDSDFNTRKNTYKKIGDLYYHFKGYKKGVKYYLNAMNCIEKSKSSQNELTLYYRLLYSAFTKSNEYDKALFYCHQELSLMKKDSKEVCKILYRIAKLQELNDSEFEEIYGSYETAKIKCASFNYHQLKIKCLKKMIRLSEEAKNLELVEKAKKELRSADCTEPNSSNESQSDNESQSQATDSDTPYEVKSDSDFDVQEVIHESDNDNESFHKFRERSKRTKYALKRNEKGETELHLAVIRGNTRKVRSLLEKGHPVNVQDTAGWTPLHEACNFGFPDLVELLIEKGADVNDKGGISCEGCTPLHDAAANGKLEVIDVLIKNGASAMVLNKNGETPLQLLLNWRANSAMDKEEDEQFNKIVNALKSPLDLGVADSIQHKLMDKNMRDKRKSMSKSSSPGSSTCRPKKSPGISRRKRVVSSDEDGHSNDSDDLSEPQYNSSRSIRLYREVIKNLRHKPKKFKTYDTGKKHPLPALIDETDYVKKFIIDSDEDDGDEDDNHEEERKGDKTEPNKSALNSDEETNQYVSKRTSTSPKTKSSTPIDSDLSILDDCSIVDLLRDFDDSPEKHGWNFGQRSKSPVIYASHSSRKNVDQLLEETDNKTYSTPEAMDVGLREDFSPNSSNDSGLSCPKTLNSNTISSPESVTINVDILSNTLKIPVKKAQINDLKVDWIVRQVGKQYPFVENCDYHVCLKSKTNPAICESDPLISVINENVQFVVTKWKLLPLGERYEKVCSIKNHVDITSELKSSSFKYTALPQVLEILKKSTYKQFSLSNLKLTAMTLVPICKTLKYESYIQVLNLSANYFGDKGIELVMKIFNNCIIEELNLSGCNITSSGVYLFSDALSAMNEITRNGLQVLNFSKNPITDDAVEAINNIIIKTPNLTVLYIDGCELETKISHEISPNLLIVQDVS